MSERTLHDYWIESTGQARKASTSKDFSATNPPKELEPNDLAAALYPHLVSNRQQKGKR